MSNSSTITNVNTSSSSNMYIIRPAMDFVSDMDDKYLELHYPDLFPFGRGGFNEKRKINISRSALLRHLLNLSTRQFQEVDFLLPLYDMKTRRDVAKMSFVRSILPSRNLYNGSISTRAETYGRVSSEDLQLACSYKLACAKAASEGRPFPAPPVSLNGLAMDFFTDISIACTPMQHSQAAAIKNRQDVYAAHNSNGKAHIWFTFSPDDSMSFKILWYALGANEAAPHKDNIPNGEFRFKLIAKKPVAAALYFERILEIVIERMIGWDVKKCQPLEGGGIFGVPKAWLRVVEEQSRLTLHAHFLVWIYGHADLQGQLREAMQKDQLSYQSSSILSLVTHVDAESLALPSQSTSVLFENSFSRNHVENPIEVTQEEQIAETTLDLEVKENTAVHDLLAKIQASIDQYITGELLLPTEEMEVATRCPLTDCEGQLVVISKEILIDMRKKAKNSRSQEQDALRCSKCSKTCSISSQIKAALEHGYQRCFGRKVLDDEEVRELIWKGLPPKPEKCSTLETDRWLLNLSSVQVLVNMHDWKHRNSCFKSGRTSCRYKIPQFPIDETSAVPILSKTDVKSEEDASQKEDIIQLVIDIKKRPVFIFLTDCNDLVLSALSCNNCVRYVQDQKVSLYYGAYASKHNQENEKSLTELMRCLTVYEKRRITRMQNEETNSQESNGNKKTDNVPHSSDSSFGLGRLLSGARASTNGETVGAPLAAFAARNNKVFEMSHETAVLPLIQAKAFLRGQPLRASISKGGLVLATIYDYVFRTKSDPIINGINYWSFVSTQETIQLQKSTEKKDQDLTDEDGEMSDEGVLHDNISDKKHNRQIFLFEKGHPRRKIVGHHYRKIERWPKYSAKRLPNVADLNENSSLDVEERNSKREEYAEGVLIMFHPFRELKDIFDDGKTWWQSFLKRRNVIYSNKKTLETLNSIQNYYESFCTSRNIIGEPTFEEDLIHKEPVEQEEEDTDVVGYQDICTSLDANQNVTNIDMEGILAHPFVRKIAKLEKSSPIGLNVKGWSEEVSVENAIQAINEIQSSRSQDERSAKDVAKDDVYNTSETITRVELLEHIEEALLRRNCIQVPADNSQPERLETFYPTLEEHSRHWTLNDKQHMAFVLMASALLQQILTTNSADINQTPASDLLARFARISAQLEEILPSSKQLLMFLGGCGGTGKSRIIQAFLDFARRWHSTSSVIVSATSGIAAMLIGGCTLHSALGISTKSNPPKPSQNHIIAWSPICILIIDEVSMMRASLLDLLDTRLRQLKTRFNKLFGGIHIVFSGDFYQLPPVGTALIACENMGRKKKNDQLSSLRGQELWKTCLNDAIILDENRRQVDPEWSASLLRWRTNEPSEEDINLVNMRCIDPETTTTVTPRRGIPVAVCDNLSRESALRYFEYTMLQNRNLGEKMANNWREGGVLLIQAKVSQAEGHQPIQPKHETYVRNLSSKRLKGAGHLFCVTNAPYMVTNNQDVKKGVANGTLCTLIDVLLKDTAVVRVVNMSGNNVHAVYADEVMCLIFQHNLRTWKNDNSFPSLRTGCFPLITITKNVIIPLGKREETFTARTTLFPCELATVLTGHKMQGQTMNSIILGNLSTRHKYGSTGWIYVVLSRVTSLSGLQTLIPLETNIHKFKSRTEIKEEMNRLCNIQESTITRLKKIIFEF